MLISTALVIFTLASMFFCSRKVDKKIKVRKRKSKLRKKL